MTETVRLVVVGHVVFCRVVIRTKAYDGKCGEQQAEGRRQMKKQVRRLVSNMSGLLGCTALPMPVRRRGETSRRRSSDVEQRGTAS